MDERRTKEAEPGYGGQATINSNREELLLPLTHIAIGGVGPQHGVQVLSYPERGLYRIQGRGVGGHLVEINLHREFKFEDGIDLNCRIVKVDVDCKYSRSLGAWTIPPEAHGHLCLMLWADDTRSQWSMGVVRTTCSIRHPPSAEP